jgi:hypothetical protein
LLVKSDAELEAGAPLPAPVRSVLEQWKQQGVLQSEITLGPSKRAARSKVTGGKRVWFDGPFTESKELVAGFSILEVPGIDDAKRFADDYATILGDNEVDIREVVA